MKRSAFVWTIAILMLAAAPALAGQRGHGGGAPKPPAPTHAQGPKTQPAPHGKPPSAGTKPTTHGASATHGSSSAHGGAAKTTKTTTTTTTKTTTTSGATTTSATTTLTPVQQKLQKNTNLASKLESRLPAGTDLMTAADGFRNLGQFVAAVNVSNNLGISFTELKSRMVDDKMSLGQAIKDLRPTADQTIVTHAESDADALIRSTESTTTTTTTSKSKTKPKSKDKPKTDKHGSR